MILEPRVELSWQELEVAARVGIRRNIEDHRDGLGVGYFDAFGDGGWTDHILGAAGELAFSKFRRKPWRPARMKERDVDGFQVRTVYKPRGELKIRKRDSGSDRFALVAHRAQFRVFVIAGWVTGEEGRKLGRLLNPNGWGPAYFVPQERLRKDFP